MKENKIINEKNTFKNNDVFKNRYLDDLTNKLRSEEDITYNLHDFKLPKNIKNNDYTANKEILNIYKKNNGENYNNYNEKKVDYTQNLKNNKMFELIHNKKNDKLYDISNEIEKLNTKIYNFTNLNNKNQFQPTLIKEKNNKEIPQNLKIFQNWLNLSVYERNSLWLRNKERKKEDNKLKCCQKTTSECTFRPKTSSFIIKSTDKYASYNTQKLGDLINKELKSFDTNKFYQKRRVLRKKFEELNKPIRNSKSVSNLKC